MIFYTLLEFISLAYKIMKILTNSNIIYGEIEKLIENSREFLYLISPYIEFEIKDHNSYEKFKK